MKNCSINLDLRRNRSELGEMNRKIERFDH
nr:MAG TPA: hypothetical protein [Caudoviricetes sp.]DAN58672.1 MAG TPA: hypothetical protein [Caudoviricetes sp.]DAQ94344.1 MAG TPA: hypothetical protein [Caudoviricetes sp.]DAU58427.1 MAG TPA: hypothetical protein [Caudoviricetes sp.]